MADRHEQIKWDVIKLWTEEKRGRLYCVNQGMATPLNGNHPIWFGPLKRVFKGMPDTMGFEYMTVYKNKKPDTKSIRVPVFCVVEIKTRNDNLSVHQKRVIRFLVSIGALCYVAKENKDDDDYTLKRWEG